MKEAGLKPASRANIMCAGRSILRWCIDAGHLLEMPRLPRLPKAGEVVIHPPKHDDVVALLAAAPPHIALALALSADAGLRAGEVRGLEWQDVDLEGRTLTVRQTIYHGQKDTPKSGHQRQIPLTKRLHDLLFEAAQTPHTLTAPLAPNIHGKVWGEPSLLHALQRVLAELGMPMARVHDLRHLRDRSLPRRRRSTHSPGPRWSQAHARDGQVRPLG